MMDEAGFVMTMTTLRRAYNDNDDDGLPDGGLIAKDTEARGGVGLDSTFGNFLNTQAVGDNIGTVETNNVHRRHQKYLFHKSNS